MLSVFTYHNGHYITDHCMENKSLTWPYCEGKLSKSEEECLTILTLAKHEYTVISNVTE